MTTYSDSVDGITATQLEGFFEGWANRPSPETHLELLKRSAHRIIARNDDGSVIGFVTATTDGVLSANIPLLEVLPSHRKQGIGSELMRQMLGKLDGMYMTDLSCDNAMCAFYERFGMRKGTAMLLRKPEHIRP